MRIKGVDRLFSYSRYRRLKKDFVAPLRALYATSGMQSGVVSLQTITGGMMSTDRGDLVVWDAYFNPVCCRVEISNGLFHVVPDNPEHADYYIQGANGCMTYRPERWNANPGNAEFISWLQSKERSVYSQHGEDGVFEALIGKIPTAGNFIVEFGAYDGICMSNSRYHVNEKGWSALLIEADSRFYSSLRDLYKDNHEVKTVKSFVTTDNINDLFHDASVPQDFDILSIDIDSIDYYVWEALTEFTPKIVVIEYNASIPPDQTYVVEESKAVECSGTSREGASILSLYELGKRKGYQLVYAELNGANLFFVHEDYMGYFDAQDIQPRDVYQPPQFGILCGGNAINGRGYI